ncbi:MAG: hypothetical protein AB7G17_00835 [Phycisphaerales bacterium]
MGAESRVNLGSVIVWTTTVAPAHFRLATCSTHAVHGLHIILSGMFLLPILVGASAFATRSGAATAPAASVLYAAHLVWSWRDSPLGNAGQYAMIAVYFIGGLAAGRLVEIANACKWQRDEVIRRAHKASKEQKQ